MSIKDDIKGYIVMKGMTVSSLAREMGVTQQVLARKINNESLRYKDVLDIADVLGYEIIWKKKE